MECQVEGFFINDSLLTESSYSLCGPPPKKKCVRITATLPYSEIVVTSSDLFRKGLRNGMQSVLGRKKIE